MQNPDTQGNFQPDLFGFEDDHPTDLSPTPETGDSFSVTPEENPWFFDDELTPAEKAAAEIWAEEHNLYYYTL